MLIVRITTTSREAQRAQRLPVHHYEHREPSPTRRLASEFYLSFVVKVIIAGIGALFLANPWIRSEFIDIVFKTEAMPEHGFVTPAHQISPDPRESWDAALFV